MVTSVVKVIFDIAEHGLARPLATMLWQHPDQRYVGNDGSEVLEPHVTDGDATSFSDDDLFQGQGLGLVVVQPLHAW